MGVEVCGVPGNSVKEFLIPILLISVTTFSGSILASSTASADNDSVVDLVSVIVRTAFSPNQDIPE